MNCSESKPLVPLYLDGELSEAQAAPLRKHLLDCRGCRGAAQGDKALKAWFEDDGPIEVPSGFAARVARRAFAGDTGERWDTVPAETETREGRLLSFVLQVTAAAAAVLIALSIAFRTVDLPQSDALRADDFSMDSALQELDRLNEEEAASEATPEAEDGEE